MSNRKRRSLIGNRGGGMPSDPSFSIPDRPEEPTQTDPGPPAPPVDAPPEAPAPTTLAGVELHERKNASGSTYTETGKRADDTTDTGWSSSVFGGQASLPPGWDTGAQESPPGWDTGAPTAPQVQPMDTRGFGAHDEPPTEEAPSAMYESPGPVPGAAPMTVPEPPPIPGLFDRFTPQPAQGRNTPGTQQGGDAPSYLTGMPPRNLYPEEPPGPKPEAAPDNKAGLLSRKQLTRPEDDDDDDEAQHKGPPVMLLAAGGAVLLAMAVVGMILFVAVNAGGGGGDEPAQPAASNAPIVVQRPITVQAAPATTSTLPATGVTTTPTTTTPETTTPAAATTAPATTTPATTSTTPTPPPATTTPSTSTGGTKTTKSTKTKSDTTASTSKTPVATGTLKIRSNRRVLVKINGQPRDYSPLDLPTAAGSYTVSAALPGKPETEQTKTVELKAGAVESINFTF